MHTCRRFVLIVLAAALCLSARTLWAGEEPPPKEPPPKEKKGDGTKGTKPKGEPPKGEEPKGEEPKADEKKAEEQKPAEYIGEYVWGPHISKADLEGKVLLCVAFDGEDRTAPSIPQMALGQIKDTDNLQVVLVLTDKAKITKALRVATATKIDMPIIADAKIPGLKVEKDDKGKEQTTLLLRTPDGRDVFSGKPDRGKARSTVDDVKKTLAQYPSPVLAGRAYPKLQATIRQLSTATSYAPILAALNKIKEKGKDPTEKEDARALAYNIENYGALLMKKAEYFEPLHLPTAQETYAAIAKAFKGMDAGTKAEERLKAIKDDKATVQEMAACRLLDQIRQQAGLLAPAKGAEAVDLSNAECAKAPFNKSAAAKVFQDAATFKKKYKDARIAKEFDALMATYGVKLPDPK